MGREGRADLAALCRGLQAGDKEFARRDDRQCIAYGPARASRDCRGRRHKVPEKLSRSAANRPSARDAKPAAPHPDRPQESTMAHPKGNVLLVGSVPLASVEEVFRTCGTLLGNE